LAEARARQIAAIAGKRRKRNGKTSLNDEREFDELFIFQKFVNI
jgi:hypothetical protein